MNGRIKRLVSLLPKVNKLADIGCDHGYLTLYSLLEGKCKTAVVSDVSEKCLSKAKKLLSSYVEKGLVTCNVSNGFNGVGKVDLAVIAGMGGEETKAILLNAEFLPDKLLLQPMKNTEKVRETLIEKGYMLKKDFVFLYKNKFYDVIYAEKGEDFLTPEELEFGRDNVKNPSQDFIKKLEEEKKLILSVINKDLGEKSRAELNEKLKKIEKYV